MFGDQNINDYAWGTRVNVRFPYSYDIYAGKIITKSMTPK